MSTILKPEDESKTKTDYLEELRNSTIEGWDIPADYIQGAGAGFERGVAWARKQIVAEVEAMMRESNQAACEHPNQTSTWSATQQSTEHFHCPDCDKRWSD